MKYVLDGRWQMAATWLLVVPVMVISIMLPAGLFAEGIRIGVVNTEKILRESIVAITAQKKIEQEFQTRDAQIKELSTQTKTLQQELEKHANTMTEEERRSKERELAGLSRRYQRAQQQMREDLSLRQNEEYGLILERINQVIRELAERQAYDLILQLQDSVYRSARIDITDQVIRVLNEQELVPEKR